MSRFDLLLKVIARAHEPMTLAQAVDALGVPAGVERNRFSANVAASLQQLVNLGKLERSGTWRYYAYRVTHLAGKDLRVEPPRKPRKRPTVAPHRAARPKPMPAPKPKPAAKAASTPPAPAVSNTDIHRFSLRPKGPPKLQPGQRETVEQFLARGGRIQKLRPGECSHNTAPLSPREVADVTWRARQLQASARKGAANTDLDDVDDDADAA